MSSPSGRWPPNRASDSTDSDLVRRRPASQGLEPAQPLFLIGDAAAEEADQELELVVGVDRERGRAFIRGAVELLCALAKVGRGLDEDAPAVARVACAPCEAFLLEAVDDGRDRAGAEAHALGEPAGGHRAFLVEEVEAAVRVAVEAEELRDLRIEDLGRRLGGAHGSDELADQFVSRTF